MEVLNTKHLAAKARIETLFLDDIPVSVATSFGKDSSVLLDLTLSAAIAAKEKGHTPFILVTNGDTGVENPEIAEYVKTESKKVVEYAKENDIDLQFHIAKPHLNDTWAVRIIGGRALPSFPQTNHDCAVDWKINPMRRLRKTLLKKSKVSSGKEVVTLVGTRFSESAARNKNMLERNETQDHPTRNQQGDLVWPVIANFDADDVWEYIGLTRSKLIKSYSDFDELCRIYADSGGTSCAVISDSITEGMKAARSSCGARTGCHTCLAVRNDKSLTNMIIMDQERYGYLEPLNKLRTFLLNTQWDFSRRQWVGRTVDDQGRIAIQPDVYSPKMCLELLRYALSIDATEQEYAYRHGKPPRFELVPLEAVVAIDAIWSLQSMHKPFQAIMEYIEIVDKGKRYKVPDIPEFPRQPIPKTRYIKTGDYAKDSYYTFLGLRDPLLEAVGELGCRTTRQLKNGKTVFDVETEPTFTVNTESVLMAIDYELDTMMQMHLSSNGKRALTAGYRWWARLGVISLSPQQVSIHDEILKRSSMKETLGISGPDVDMNFLFSLTEQEEAPVVVQPQEKSIIIKIKVQFSRENQIDLFSFLESAA
ncbi:phosphoadenosine phosphosulfate reductase family protein [Methylomonas sp. AM2-LC]|uniref:phosphoadenosine phosphosulfate reductase domain-containing protein n=1 Tax=Methylomonas sp. AM2-LC TaxID=3153301 RepID=UPI003266ADDA